MADAPQFVRQNDAAILQRFKLYKSAGVRSLRTSLSFRDERPDGSWAPSNERWLRLAVQSGLHLRLEIETVSGPPAWFLAQNPDARLTNCNGEYSTNMISYWYPGFRDLIASKTAKLVQYLYQTKLINSVDTIIVDLGPAGEPLYPAPWTMGPGHTDANEAFWFCGPGPQGDFQQAAQAKYRTLSAANTRWGTRFDSWQDVRIDQQSQRTPAMWRDVLAWYRDAKRKFIVWQIGNVRSALSHYAPAGSVPLTILLPADHITSDKWEKAVASDDGDTPIKVMTDTDFVIETAKQYHTSLQYTALPDNAELSYITGQIAKGGAETPLWAENVGSAPAADNPAELAREAAAWRLQGVEFVNSGYLFDPTGTHPTPVWGKYVAAFAGVAQ
jgi:hypothetical protein